MMFYNKYIYKNINYNKSYNILNNMKNYILINWLIRDKQIFYKQFDIYKQLLSDKVIDEIILVIDREKILDGNNIPLGKTLDLQDRLFLNDNYVRILEIDPLIETRPRNPLRQNTLTGLSFWRPMYSLKKGLEVLEKNSYVLKN